MTTKITLNNRQLHDLLKPVLPLAEVSGWHPVLATVQICRIDSHLVATATDRYRIGFKRVLVEDMPDGDFLAGVDAVELARLLTLFRPSRASFVNQPKLTLEIQDDTLVATAIPSKKADEAHDFGALTVGCRLSDHQLPDLAKLVIETIEAAPKHATPVDTFTLNLDLFAGFKEAVKHSDEYGGGGANAIEVTTGSEPSKPLFVRIGEDFVGLIMPKRSHVEPEYRAKSLEGWAKQLKATQALTAPARRKALTG